MRKDIHGMHDLSLPSMILKELQTELYCKDMALFHCITDTQEKQSTNELVLVMVIHDKTQE